MLDLDQQTGAALCHEPNTRIPHPIVAPRGKLERRLHGRLQRSRRRWKDVGRLFAAAMIIDLIYEIIVFRWIYPGQSLIVAATLALPTYFLLRGLSNRLAQWWLNSEERRHGGGRPL